MNFGMPNQALERTGLSRWGSPWGFWFAHISSPVAQLGRSAYRETPLGQAIQQKVSGLLHASRAVPLSVIYICASKTARIPLLQVSTAESVSLLARIPRYRAAWPCRQ